MFPPHSEHGIFQLSVNTVSTTHASCPSALQSSKGKTPLREQEAFANYYPCWVLFWNLVYLTQTAGPFFFFLNDWVFQSFPRTRSMANFLSASTRWLCMYICKYPVIAGLEHFVLQFTFLKFIVFLQLLFIIPRLSVANSAIYFTVSTSSKGHISFCPQLSALPWAYAGGGGLPSL